MKLEKQFSEIRTLIQKAKNDAFKTINTVLIDLYWEIGKYVGEKINNSEWGKSVVEQLSEFIQKTTQKILSLLKSEPNITREELAKEIGITSDGVKYHLAKIKKEGIIKRIEPDKGRHWEVV